MPSLLDIAFDYFIATIIGFALNFVFIRTFSSKTIKGDPFWMYYLSITTQTLIFPTLSFLSWREQNYQFEDWFGAVPWDQHHSIFFSRAYKAALWGYWIKDLFILSDPLIVIHHVFCIASLFIGISQRHIGGLGFLIIGTQILEVGTLFYNLSTINPKSRTLRKLYWITMTVSNFIAIAMAVWFYSKYEMPFYSRAFYLVCVLGIGIGRQRECILDYRIS